MNKKEECKYILDKHMLPFTNFSLFLIIGSKKYIFYPKNLMKIAATMLFGRKVSHDSIFKKDSQLDFAVVLLRKIFALIR